MGILLNKKYPKVHFFVARSFFNTIAIFLEGNIMDASSNNKRGVNSLFTEFLSAIKITVFFLTFSRLSEYIEWQIILSYCSLPPHCMTKFCSVYRVSKKFSHPTLISPKSKSTWQIMHIYITSFSKIIFINLYKIWINNIVRNWRKCIFF